MHKNYIFQIGLNKSGTRTIHELFLRNGYQSCHFKCNSEFILQRLLENIKSNRLLLDGFGNHNAFTDFINCNNDGIMNKCFHLVDRLKNDYPDAVFILNIRDYNKWLLSRINHFMNFDLNPNPATLRFRDEIKANLPDYNKELMKTLREELNRWFKWHSQIIDLFINESEKLIIIDIDEKDFIKKLSKYLNLEDSNYLHEGNTSNKFFEKLPDDQWF